MSCHQLSLIIIFMWELVSFSGIVLGKVCILDNLFECAQEETCVQDNNSASGVCRCKKEYYTDSSGHCIPLPTAGTTNLDNLILPTPESVYSPKSSASAITIGLLVPIILISIIAGVLFAARKYKWLHRVRERAHQLRTRNYDTVLVNQEDDPPIA